MEIRMVGYQMAVSSDIRENACKIRAAIDWAADAGAEIPLTPEGPLSGYTHRFDARTAEAALGVVAEHARTLGACGW